MTPEEAEQILREHPEIHTMVDRLSPDRAATFFVWLERRGSAVPDFDEPDA